MEHGVIFPIMNKPNIARKKKIKGQQGSTLRKRRQLCNLDFRNFRSGSGERRRSRRRGGDCGEAGGVGALKRRFFKI